MKKRFASRKAQITIFIIIGIILLFSSALIIYIKNQITNSSPPPTIIQNVPEDLLGLKKYIEECAYSTAKDGIILLGAHGGYIYPEKYGVTPNELFPTEGLGLEVFPKTGYVVPYWNYLSSGNRCSGDCRFSSKMPPLTNGQDSLESQISEYVDANLRFCIDNFKVYKEMGFSIQEKGKMTTATTITQEDVVIDLTWPLEAGTDKPKRIEKFLVRIPVNLRRVYDFASLLTEKQSENSYLEVHTLNLIAMYSDKDKDQLPPMADYTFLKGAQKTWLVDDVKQKLSTALFLYVPLLRVKDTNNGIRYFYPEQMTQTVMDKMIIDLKNENEFYPLTVNFKYSKLWPIYFDITPKNGNVISPKNPLGDFGVLPLLGLSINQYEFQYDISYPVLVELRDPKAFNGEGYGFLFAIESNIRNNKALKADFQSVQVNNYRNTFACDEQQKKSGEVTISTFDALSKKPLEGAAVSFSFANQGCELGVTQMENTTAFLTEKYPQGIGLLTVSKKPDYLSVSKLYAVSENKTDYLNISLYPIVEKNVSLKKYDIEKLCKTKRWYFNETPQDLRENETATIIISKAKSLEAPDELFESVYFNGSVKNESFKIRIGPGQYKVTIMLTLYDNLTIPTQTKTYGKRPHRTKVTYQEQRIAPHNEGIVELGDETFYFEVKPEDLYKNNTLEFYAVGYDLKSVPLSCRTHDPSDFSPSPSIKDFVIQKKGLVTPAFVQIE